MANNILPPYSKVKVYWDDQTHNYSREAKTKIRNQIAAKYGVQKNNINVVYRPIKIGKNGEVIEITGAGIENIMDVSYQRSLMKELITRDKISIDFDRIAALDNIVNAELDLDSAQPKHRTWSIKWIMLDNFLSFGESNYIPFNKLKGLTIVNSEPANQGGKTTLTIDAIKFLLHGNTTKTETNEQIFNTYSDKNELVVRGMIDIEGVETIIERKMRRTAKKGGTWTIVNKVRYFTLLPDGEEEELNEENAIQTTKTIKETIGSEKDFEMLVLATEKNLEDLIGLSSTESGKVLTRLIGLEVLEKKEKVGREMYNEFARKKKSNIYDTVTLTQEIEEHNQNLINGGELEIELKDKLEKTKTEIINLNAEIESKINSKEKIDVSITELNPESLEASIASITEKGVGLATKIKETEAIIATIGTVEFDEDEHVKLTKSFNSNTTDKAVKNAEINRLSRDIAGLISGGICQSCNRKLDDVDNTDHIKKHQDKIKQLESEVLLIEDELKKTSEDLSKLDLEKNKVDQKNRLELAADRLAVEVASLRNDIITKRNDLKKYQLNLESISFNKRVEVEITYIKTKLAVSEHSKEQLISNVQRIETDLAINRNEIVVKNKLIEVIKKEEGIEKVFKVYIDLVGKKGISKLVLRSVLPIINSEAQRLLEDVVDFEIEIFINDKNDVQFLIVKDGVAKLLKSGSGLEKTASSLALRAVLGKLSTLPMPNFITFDEVLGKVAPENLEKLKFLFDKISDMYEIVFFITHNDLVKDWSTNLVTIVKTNNISKVQIK